MAEFMFEYVHLKNFKSFSDLYFDLLDKRNEPKKLVFIYGENGIGKTNLASCFHFLLMSLSTLNNNDIVESLLTSKIEKIDKALLSDLINAKYSGIEQLIHEYKMAASLGNLSIEFGFRLNGKHGKYLLETDDAEVIHERLEYVLSKNRGVYCDLTPQKRTINSRIFKSKSAYNEIVSACSKYWGKHTFFATVFHEINDKSSSYILDQIEDNFARVIHYFSRLSCKITTSSSSARSTLSIPPGMISELKQGFIEEGNIDKLNKAEKMLNVFFKAVSKDTESLYYIRNKEDDLINYRLIHRKRIAGKVRDIDFTQESTGIKALLDLLPYMLVTSSGSTSVIDEFDMGVHDLLADKLVESMSDTLNGQLIMTTHNISIMDSGIPYDCLYVINELEDQSKEVFPITHYYPKLNKHSSVSAQYLKGSFTAIPKAENVNFSKLLSMLELDI